MCSYTCVCAHTYTRAHLHMHTHVHARVLIRTHMHTCTRVHAHTSQTTYQAGNPRTQALQVENAQVLAKRIQVHRRLADSCICVEGWHPEWLGSVSGYRMCGSVPKPLEGQTFPFQSCTWKQHGWDFLLVSELMGGQVISPGLCIPVCPTSLAL